MSSDDSWKDIITGQRRGPVAAGLRGLLRVASLGWNGITAGRNACFDHGWLRTTRAAVPVISIGNLTTGGTGKTPMVATVVRLLQQLNRRPGIISRGYRADSSGTNDEWRVLQHLCPDVPHLQNPDRVAAASEIIARHQVDVIVLDDGFQHRRIGRDLDVVLIDSTNPFGGEALLPRGLLRESMNGLRRADQVIITRCDQVSSSRLTEIEAQISAAARQHQGRVLRVSFQPTALLDLAGEALPLDQIAGQRAMILTAIGNPQGFVETCRLAGADIIRTRFFPDHYHFAAGDLSSALTEAAEHEATLLLTTVKDIVKLQQLEQHVAAATGIQVAALEIATKFESDSHQDQLRSVIEGAVQQTSHEKGST